ncbi:ankyrin repeat and SOCS box protein 12 [Ornithorhynchus anatinus]|uniref:Ankyrin repeat and SOCS box containing 12 n=1 Tax=Ornithorhynchus anatinus TaxID=9258 RepID=A0A6I8N8P4_ORNAN|nr:ankyrin repeat and SOCS box protein 12 [Ornithorhynchus anatinus]XP_028923925.1 ankyrin repeat and SOCS box protein 12 [Ornithorhynchus anatinus]
MRVASLRSTKTSHMDVTKIFSLLRLEEEEEVGERMEGEGEEAAARAKQELSRAVGADDHGALDLLLRQPRYKRFIDSRSGWGVPGTPLRLAAARGHPRCLRVLLAHGAEVDRLDAKAQTPLFTAVSHGHAACVRLLLEAGASPLGSAFNNCSPVLAAARDGHRAILRALLAHGADANVRARVPAWAPGPAGCTGPLYLAAAYGHLECFRLLLLHGADPDYNCTDPRLLARVSRPRTLLELCLRRGCGPDYVRLLVDFGANVYLPPLPPGGPPADGEAVALLRRERAHPKPLMSQARLAVRRALPLAGRAQVVDQLGLPPRLADYLKHQS